VVASIDAQIDRLMAIIGDLAKPPATQEQLAQAAHRYGALPPQIWSFYSRLNGIREMTPVEHGAIRFWPIETWAPVKMKAALPTYADVSELPIVGDYLIDCWWFAVDCIEGSPNFGAVLLIDGARPALIVAKSFAQFVQAVLDDDESLYPPAAAG
jgi:hypothetical protein